MKKKYQTNPIINHVREYSSIYLFCTVLFLIGIIFGAILVNSLSYSQKEDLFYFLNEYLGQLSNGELVSSKDIFFHSLTYNSKFIGLIWILGISIIGLPLIVVLLFLKGMVIGFTVGFLVSQMKWSGMLVSFVSVLPQNFIIVPVYLFMTVTAISFSILMIRKLFVKAYHQPFGPQFVQYIITFTLAVLVLSTAALVEGYVTPLLMKGIISFVGS